MWVLFCLVFLSISLVGVAGITCQQPDICKCETDEGTVDLGPVSAVGTPPVFSTVSAADGNSYDYDPCNTFTSGSGDCNDVLVCQQTQYGDYWGIGDSTGFTWGNDPFGGALMISYTHYGSDGVTRKSEVTLVCDISSTYDQLIALGEIGTAAALYKFTLTSEHACPKGASTPGPTTNATTSTTTTTTTTEQPPAPDIGMDMCLLVNIILGVSLMLILTLLILVTILYIRARGSSQQLSYKTIN